MVLRYALWTYIQNVCVTASHRLRRTPRNYTHFSVNVWITPYTLTRRIRSVVHRSTQETVWLVCAALSLSCVHHQHTFTRLRAPNCPHSSSVREFSFWLEFASLIRMSLLAWLCDGRYVMCLLSVRKTLFFRDAFQFKLEFWFASFQFRCSIEFAVYFSFLSDTD